jgi:hypothetical protein
LRDRHTANKFWKLVSGGRHVEGIVAPKDVCRITVDLLAGHQPSWSLSVLPLENPRFVFGIAIYMSPAAGFIFECRKWNFVGDGTRPWKILLDCGLSSRVPYTAKLESTAKEID